MPSSYQLVADIGGTNARFACVAGTELLHIQTLRCADHATPEAAISTYLAMLPPELHINKLCIALAGLVDRDLIQLTNNHWCFSREGLARQLGFAIVTINDFTAQALCLDTLRADELRWIGMPRPRGDRMRVVVGPGTGLGVAGLHPSGVVLTSEGGHIGVAPLDTRGIAQLQLLWQRFPRLSVERLLSGPGLSNLYWANSMFDGRDIELDAPAITAGALAGDPLCRQTVQDFLDMLAAVAGDLALVLGAQDGVYLCGGILPRLVPLFDDAKFLRIFQNKGRFTDYCINLPLALVQAEHTGLRGCVAALRKGLI